MAVRQFVFPVDPGRRSWKKPSAVPLAVLSGGGVLCLAVALAMASSKPGPALVFALVGAWLLLLGYAIHRLTRIVPSRWVRVKDSRERLTFVPAREVVALHVTLSAGLLVMWLAMVAVWLGPGGDAAFTGRFGFAPIAVLPVLVLWFLWTLRGPVGLTVTPQGIEGVKFVKRVRMPWSAISDVSVQPVDGRGKVIVFTGFDVKANIDSAFIGSDAYAIRTVLRHFIVHPEDRERLAEGIGALELFGVEVEALERR